MIELAVTCVVLVVGAVVFSRVVANVRLVVSDAVKREGR